MNERERIEYIMNGYGLTPSQFADKTGIPRASVSHILSGRNKPSLEVLQKVASVFPDVNLQWLMLGIGNNPEISGTIIQPDTEPSLQKVQEAIFQEEAQLFDEYNNQMQQERVQQQPLFQSNVKRSEQRQAVAVPEKSSQRDEQPRVPKSTVKNQPQQRRVVVPRSVEQPRHIKEIRVFYSDGTYEILYPEK